VTANDKKSIVELARTVGMERPRRVSTSPPLAPGCHVVIVTSDLCAPRVVMHWCAPSTTTATP